MEPIGANALPFLFREIRFDKEEQKHLSGHIYTLYNVCSVHRGGGGGGGGRGRMIQDDLRIL